MTKRHGQIDAAGVLFWALAGFLLAVGIIEGAAVEGAHIMRGHEERAAIITAATRAGVEIPPDTIRTR